MPDGLLKAQNLYIAVNIPQVITITLIKNNQLLECTIKHEAMITKITN